jgi:Zn-dependent peptidase ImmA (M78 family)
MTGEEQPVSDDHVFTLNGDERWLLRFTTLKGQAYGYTYSQKSAHPRIVIDARLRGRKRLEVLVHELLHALNPTQSEEHVTQQGKDLARVLWSLGYREVTDGKP